MSQAKLMRGGGVRVALCLMTDLVDSQFQERREVELRVKREEEERKRREEKRRQQQQQQEEQKRRQEEEELFRRKQVGA